VVVDMMASPYLTTIDDAHKPLFLQG